MQNVVYFNTKKIIVKGSFLRLDSFLKPGFWNSEIGTLRSNDANDNENVKNNRFKKQNSNFAHTSHFFEHFFPVFARLRRENA